MSKEQFKKDILSSEGYILSDATLNLEHLLSKAYDLMKFYGIQTKGLMEEILKCFRFEDALGDGSLFEAQYFGWAELTNEELANYLWNEDIFYLFCNLSPKGYYFGSSEGEGACIGWFKAKDEEDEEDSASEDL